MCSRLIIVGAWLLGRTWRIRGLMRFADLIATNQRELHWPQVVSDMPLRPRASGSSIALIAWRLPACLTSALCCLPSLHRSLPECTLDPDRHAVDMSSLPSQNCIYLSRVLFSVADNINSLYVSFPLSLFSRVVMQIICQDVNKLN